MLWALLLACSTEVLGPSPVAIAIVQSGGGASGTAVIHTDGPGGEPIVQWRPSWVAWTPEEAYQLRGQGQQWTVSHADLHGEPEGEPFDRFTGVPVHVTPSGVWVADDEVTWRRGFDGRISDAARPPQRTLWTSPGGTTAVSLSRGRLTVQPENQPATVLLDRVDDVAGLWFVDTPPPEGFARRVTVLSAEGGKGATIDGDLAEWSDQEAVAVHDPDQVLSGIEQWDGPSDGSFGVAARLHRGRLLLAVRVRDDQVGPGDQLVLLLPHRSITVPLDDPTEVPELEIASQTVRYGASVELSLQLGNLRPSRMELPLVVRLVDVDDGEEPTLLATAPDARLVGVYPEVPSDGEQALTTAATLTVPATGARGGTAIVTVAIAGDGTHQLTEWVQGPRALEPVVRTAIQAATFTPPRVDGQPVATELLVEVQVTPRP